MPAWRARAHHLTRSRVFIAKATAVILGVFALIAVLVDVSRQREHARASAASLSDPGAAFKAIVKEGAQRLESMPGPAPERLTAWLRDSATRWRLDLAARKAGFDALALRLAGVELHPLIVRHTTGDAQGDAVAAYTRFSFLPDGEARQSALQSLDQLAKGTPPPPHANEMLGDALYVSNRREEALQAFLRDVPTPAATHARRIAVELAREQHEVDILRQLCADERVVADLDSWTLWQAAKQISDRRLLFHAMWHMLWARWMRGTDVLLALIAGAIWYVILIHTASREALRWWRYLPAVFAGMASTWMLKWVQGTLDYYREPEDAPSVVHEVMEWIMHVGLPEETVKLLLFAFFLPVLLHHKSGVKAALTAGCVGLGFALNENLIYFHSEGPMRALGRLLTANFFHVSLTGIVGWHLYELFRSRFHHASEFLIAFGGVVVAHGVYDFTCGDAAGALGLNIAGLIILGLTARFYLHMLHENERIQPAAHFISRSAVFCLGTALLGGILMVVMVWELRSLKGITLVLKEMVGLALVGLFYIREWREI